MLLSLWLFFIFISYFTFISFQLKKRWLNISQLRIILYGSLAIILCMTFPVEVAPGYIVDLRLIPLVIAGLYGGWRACLMLTFVLIGYRLFLGGEGVYFAMIIALIQGVIIVYLSQHFLALSHRKRILFSTIVGLVTPVPLLVVMGLLFGQQSPVLMLVLIVLHMAAITFFVVVSENIIKIKSLHEHFIRTEKVEILNHVASSFTHEIRNPMTTVKGFLQLMRSPDISKDEMNKYITIAISEVDRAENIITEYLLFTKPTNDDLKVIDGEQLLQTSIDVIRPLANATSVIIQCDSCSFSIKANKQKLQQALINLFKNAIEAMPNGGTLFISVAAKGKSITLMIRDTGVGMTEEQISRLGEPYFSSKGEKGTGLGMMVVYNIIEAIGGTIHVVSQLEKGTTFTLTLPKFDAKPLT